MKIWNGTINRRALFCLLLAVSLLAGVFGAAHVGVAIWTDYRDSIIDRQKQQMDLRVRSLRDNMEVFIGEYVADLDGLYEMAASNIDEIPAGELLEDYVNSHSRFVNDVIVEHNRQEWSTRGKRIREVYSISRIDDRRSLLLAKLEDGEMSLVVRKNLENSVSLSLLIDLENYYQSLIRDLKIGSSGYVVVKDAGGIILMHPEKEQWGIDVIEGRIRMYQNLNLDSLKALIDHQKQGLEGVEEYYSYWWMEPGYPRVRKICAYAPAQIGEDFLIVSEVMDYDDIFIPIAEGVLKLVSFFIVIFAVLIVLALYVVHLVSQKQKDTEHIAGLTELNRRLEDMHRSEEAIAHQQRLQIMGTMTGGIAHEFNNLLTPIMGYADLLMMELPEDSEAYDSALEIYEASDKAREIIQQISSLSRKNMETAYKNTDASRLVTRALKMVRSICPANVRLEEENRLSGECLLCNETQMNQVILNICVNAIHAIGHDEGVLRIAADTVERGQLQNSQDFALFGGHGRYQATLPEGWNRYVHLQISDTGCGMSDEVLRQIFDPFFTTRKGGKGTGLGLALVEQIIGAHKGYVFAESRPGEGSTFHVYLPVNEQKEDAALTAGEEHGGQAGGLKLLVADDNPKVLRLLQKDAAKLHITLEGCMTFEEAQSVLERQGMEDGRPFDVLAADQEISGRSAVEFCMSIQGRYPKLVKLVMTDRVTLDVAEAKQRGVIDGYLDKPVSVSSILAAMKANLNNL